MASTVEVSERTQPDRQITVPLAVVWLRRQPLLAVANARKPKRHRLLVLAEFGEDQSVLQARALQQPVGAIV